MIRVALMGTGNVARHLFDVFSKQADIQVVEVIGRNGEAIHYFQNLTKTALTNQFSEKADVYFLAVADDAIPRLSESFTPINGLLVHTSGSVPISVLPKTMRRGVFYPLQTFTKGIPIDFGKIPICIEAENETDSKLLKELGSLISNNVVEVNSSQRSGLHLAAVFVNNFTNHLYYIGQQICQDYDLPFNILLPLIWETVHKIEGMPPVNAQTGPAKRMDSMTIDHQLNLLKNPDYKDIYLKLTESIQKTYG